MKTTFVHEGDGLDGWFELVNLARLALWTIDTNAEDINVACVVANDELAYLAGRICHVTDELEEPALEYFAEKYKFYDNLTAALAARNIGSFLAAVFAPDATLTALDILVDRIIENNYQTLEEQNRWQDD